MAMVKRGQERRETKCKGEWECGIIMGLEVCQGWLDADSAGMAGIRRGLSGACRLVSSVLEPISYFFSLGIKVTRVLASLAI